MKKIVLLFLATIFLYSCRAAYQYGEEDPKNTKLTVGIVKSKVQKGVTTQSEILSLFGSPNLVTKNKDSYEVWSYNRQSSVKKGGDSDQRASVSSSSRSFDFIVTFDENDIVSDYSVISSSF